MSDVRGSLWRDWEIDAIVADYFNMLADEMAGRGFNKSEHRRALQALVERDPGSIERKHQNISAVLERLGVPFIRGYKPLAHFQNALLDAVERYLTVKGQSVFQFAATTPAQLAEAPTLWIGPPPEVSPKGTSEPERLQRLIRKFDPAERDARNRSLGKRGEELVLMHEQSRLRSKGRADLSGRRRCAAMALGMTSGHLNLMEASA